MGIAAAADAAHPSPSPQPRARRTVAWLVFTHLAWAAGDAVICLAIASMWLLFWGQATKEIGRLACGEGCAVVTAAYEVASVAVVIILVLLLPFSALLLALMIARAQAAASTTTATDIDATKEPAPETLYAAVRGALCDSVLLGVLALMAFTLLMLTGVLVKGDSPVMGSRQERMGSVIYEVGALGKYALDCFFLCPFITVQIWRCWRKARHGLRCGMQLRQSLEVEKEL